VLYETPTTLSSGSFIIVDSCIVIVLYLLVHKYLEWTEEWYYHFRTLKQGKNSKLKQAKSSSSISCVVRAACGVAADEMKLFNAWLAWVLKMSILLQLLYLTVSTQFKYNIQAA